MKGTAAPHEHAAARRRHSLTVRAARRLALARAGLIAHKETGAPVSARGGGPSARTAAHRVIDRFGYLQLDTIAVAGARSHTLVLLSRLEGMDPALGETLLRPGAPLFEYWGHEASWLPKLRLPAPSKPAPRRRATRAAGLQAHQAQLGGNHHPRNAQRTPQERNATATASGPAEHARLDPHAEPEPEHPGDPAQRQAHPRHPVTSHHDVRTQEAGTAHVALQIGVGSLARHAEDPVPRRRSRARKRCRENRIAPGRTGPRPERLRGPDERPGPPSGGRSGAPRQRRGRLSGRR